MSDDDFFVGYLLTPPAVSRRLWRIAVLLLIGASLTSLLIATQQRDPGSGRWDSSRLVRANGRLKATAYPTVQTADGRAILLVGDGKRAADIPPGSSHIIVTGSLIARDGWQMIELEHAVPSESTADSLSPPQIVSAPQRFRGEILDAKCYLGAMKPGDGKTHKACAALCLRGGIPPMFHTISNTGEPQLYLLTGPNGLAIAPDEIIPFVGDPVELEASIVSGSARPTLQLVPGSIRRR